MAGNKEGYNKGREGWSLWKYSKGGFIVEWSLGPEI